MNKEILAEIERCLIALGRKVAREYQDLVAKAIKDANSYAEDNTDKDYRRMLAKRLNLITAAYPLMTWPEPPDPDTFDAITELLKEAQRPDDLVVEVDDGSTVENIRQEVSGAGKVTCNVSATNNSTIRGVRQMVNPSIRYRREYQFWADMDR
jgi:ethanolamine utilization protein EutA (predicted chaperonin)